MSQAWCRHHEALTKLGDARQTVWCADDPKISGAVEGTEKKPGDREIEKDTVRRLRRSLSRTYSVIAKEREDGWTALVTTNSAGSEKVLPIFSYAEEAEMFLWLGRFGGGWRTREIKAEELVSVLLGPRADVERVVLDPLPEIRAGSRKIQSPRELEAETPLDRLTGRGSAQALDPDLSIVELPKEMRDGRD